MKYIQWENCFGKFLGNWHYCPKAAKIFFRTLDNLRKFAEIMDVRDETHIIHSCYAAGKNISTIILRVRTPFNLPGKAVMR